MEEPVYGIDSCETLKVIDAQPRGGNRQTAKGFCILYSFRFVVEHFESVYQLRMRVYIYEI
jgi:hypothetical protein